jgi:hypothetical protein
MSKELTTIVDGGLRLLTMGIYSSYISNKMIQEPNDKIKIEHERRMKEIDDEHNLRIGKHLKEKDESMKNSDSLDTNKSNIYKSLDDLDKNMLKIE